MTVSASNQTHVSAPIGVDWARIGQVLLLLNGVLLGFVALVAGLGDLAGHFLNLGPMAKALYGNLDAIGMFEAHGLALIVSVVLVIHRKSGSATWHWVSGATHLLLGGSNLMFWPIYSLYDMTGVGIGATAFHAVFFVLQISVAFARTPAILSGPGAWFRGLTIVTLATGTVVHATRVVVGNEALLTYLFTPQFDAVFAVPMTAAGVTGWLLLPRGIFPALWQRIVYVAMLLYFSVSIIIHARTLFTWDTSYSLAFPDWYSLPVFVLFGLLIPFTMRQRFRSASGR